MNYESYRRLVGILKKKCPLAYPVSVKRIPMKKIDGYCSLDGKKFEIRISKSLSESTAMDTLLHEWAHARAWNHIHDNLSYEDFEKRSHDASWGVAYSEVYMMFDEHFYDKKIENSNKCFKRRI